MQYSWLVRNAKTGKNASAEYRDNPIADVLSNIGKSLHSFVSVSLKRKR